MVDHEHAFDEFYGTFNGTFHGMARRCACGAVRASGALGGDSGILASRITEPGGKVTWTPPDAMRLAGLCDG